MGYNLYITKTDHPVDSAKKPITAKMWTQIVQDDEELEFVENSKASVIWVDASGDDRGRLMLLNGKIIAKNPSDELIRKMVSLAEKLGARVIGDEGEPYI